MNKIDLNVALEYLGGIREMFDIVGNSFLDSYKDSENRIKNYIKDNNYKHIYNDIHSLKGITLNLGMVNLYDSSVKVLENLKLNIINISDIDNFLKVFNETYFELNQLLNKK